MDACLVVVPDAQGREHHALRVMSLDAALSAAAPRCASAPGVYPVLVPHGQERAYATFLARVLGRGERRRQPDWRDRLLADGLRPRDFGVEGEHVSDEQFREWLSVLSERMWLPLVNDAKHGFGLARDREQADKYAVSLHDERAASWRASANGLRHHRHEWRQRIAARFAEGGNQRRLASVAEAALLDGPKRSDALAQVAQRQGLYPRLSPSAAMKQVRLDLGDLRAEGFPAAKGEGGIVWVKTDAEAEAAALGYERGAEAMSERAQLLRRNAALWWPEDDAERARRDHFVASLRLPPTAKSIERRKEAERAKRRADDKVRREAEAAALAPAIAAACARRDDPERRAAYQRAFANASNGFALSPAEQRLLDEQQDLRYWVPMSGERPAQWRNRQFARRWEWLPPEAKVRGERRPTAPSAATQRDSAAPTSRLPEGELTFEQALRG